MNRWNRRQFLCATGWLGAAITLGARHSARAVSPGIDVLETSVISHCPEFYHGWPTLAQRRSGQLLLVWSGGREAHVCPFGRVEMMVSNDQGRTWTWPQVLLDSATDDRDAGVLETARGSLLVSSFTSLAYEPILKRGGGQESQRGWSLAARAVGPAWQAAPTASHRLPTSG